MNIPRPPVHWSFLAALVGAAVLIGVLAAFRGHEPPDYASARQQDLAEEIGWPDAWILAHGPIEPGGEIHRTETWFYDERQVAVRFLDGAEVKPPVGMGEQDLGGRSTVRPTEFYYGMSLSEIEERLGEKGSPIEPFESPYAGSTGLLFARSALLVTLIDGRFFTAQTY